MGKIKGKGSGKSDSILAMLKTNDFIIPADADKKTVEGLLKHLKINKKDKLNSGRNPVLVSNGESRIPIGLTNKADMWLKKKGIKNGLNGLAPNAKQKLANGGRVNNTRLKKVEEMLKGEGVDLSQYTKKELLDAYKSFKETGIKGESVSDYLPTPTNKTKNKDITVSETDIVNKDPRTGKITGIKDTGVEISPKDSKYEFRKDVNGNTGETQYFRRSKAEAKKVKGAGVWTFVPDKDISSVSKRFNDANANNTTKDKATTDNTTKESNIIKGKGSDPWEYMKVGDKYLTRNTNSGNKDWIEAKGDAKDAIIRDYGDVLDKVAVSKDNAKDINVVSGNELDLSYLNDPARLMYGDNYTPPADVNINVGQGFNPTDVSKQGSDKFSTPNSKGGGENNGGKKFGLAEGLGIAQTAAGLIGTFAQGKRKGFQVSQTLKDMYADATRRAKYGFDPEVKNEYLRNIELQKNMAMKNIVSPSAGVSRANMLGVLRTTQGAIGDVAAKEQSLRDAKVAASYNVGSSLAGQEALAEKDRLAAFDRTQAAYGDVMQAGISNIVGAQKYRNFLRSIENTNNSGSTFNYYGG